EPRELGVDLELDPSREEREALEQPFDVGVGAFERVEPEPARDLGELFRELAAQLTQVLKLAVVVAEELLVHGFSSARGFGDLDLAVLEIELRPQEKTERERLRPQLGFDG